MNSQKLFLFDFDGVIVDGMAEYWHSSLLAFEKYLNSPNLIDQNLYKQVSNTFIEMRPWVKFGWEMLIIVHQIVKKENPLNNQNKYDIFICMFHDQALIPVKMISFDETVNYTAGLSFVRTSPDHGTGLDIAKKFIASPNSLIAAMKSALKIAETRRK